MWVIVLLSFLLLPVLIKCSKKPNPSSSNCDQPLPVVRSPNNIDISAAEKKSEHSKASKTEKSKTEKPSETDSKSNVKPIARTSSNATISALKSSNTDIKPVPLVEPIVINKEGLNILRLKLSALKNKKAMESTPQAKTAKEPPRCAIEKSADDPFLSKSGEEGNGFGCGVQKGEVGTKLKDATVLKTTATEGLAKTQEDATQKTKKNVVSKKGAAKKNLNTRTRNNTKETQEALTNQTMISTENVKTTVEVKCTVDTTVVSTKTKGNVGVTQASQDS